MRTEKFLILVLCTLGVKCNDLSTGDSQTLMRILEAVDVATSDEHLFNATLNLLESLCDCMRETLQNNEEKLRLIGDAKILTEYSDDVNKLGIYKEIYNYTCFELHNKLGYKFRHQDVSSEYHAMNDLNDVKNENNYEIKSYFEKLMYNTLIKTKELHNYTIKQSNLLRKPTKANNDILQQNIIIIISLSPLIHMKHIKESEGITYNDVKAIITTKNSRVDIDIFNTQFYDANLEMNNNTANVTSCNLQSLYNFLIEKKKYDQINILKLVNKTNSIKIYMDITTNISKIGFQNMCCTNGTQLCDETLKETHRHFNSQIKNNYIEPQNSATIQNYKETIVKIKNLVKLYEENIKKQRNYSNKAYSSDTECIGTTKETYERDTPLSKNNTKNVSIKKPFRLFKEKNRIPELGNIIDTETADNVSRSFSVIPKPLQQRDLISDSQMRDTVDKDLSTFDSLEDDNWIGNKHKYPNTKHGKIETLNKSKSNFKHFIQKLQNKISSKQRDNDDILRHIVDKHPVDYKTMDLTTKVKNNVISDDINSMKSKSKEAVYSVITLNPTILTKRTKNKIEYKKEEILPRSKSEHQTFLNSVESHSVPQSQSIHVHKLPTSKAAIEKTPPVNTSPLSKNMARILHETTELSSGIHAANPQNAMFQKNIMRKAPKQNSSADVTSLTRKTTKPPSTIADSLITRRKGMDNQNKTFKILSQKTNTKTPISINMTTKMQNISKLSTLVYKTKNMHDEMNSITQLRKNMLQKFVTTTQAKPTSVLNDKLSFSLIDKNRGSKFEVRNPALVQTKTSSSMLSDLFEKTTNNPTRSTRVSSNNKEVKRKKLIVTMRTTAAIVGMGTEPSNRKVPFLIQKQRENIRTQQKPFNMLNFTENNTKRMPFDTRSDQGNMSLTTEKWNSQETERILQMSKLLTVLDKAQVKISNNIENQIMLPIKNISEPVIMTTPLVLYQSTLRPLLENNLDLFFLNTTMTMSSINYNNGQNNAVHGSQTKKIKSITPVVPVTTTYIVPETSLRVLKLPGKKNVYTHNDTHAQINKEPLIVDLHPPSYVTEHNAIVTKYTLTSEKLLTENNIATTTPQSNDAISIGKLPIKTETKMKNLYSWLINSTETTNHMVTNKDTTITLQIKPISYNGTDALLSEGNSESHDFNNLKTIIKSADLPSKNTLTSHFKSTHRLATTESSPKSNSISVTQNSHSQNLLKYFSNNLTEPKKQPMMNKSLKAQTITNATYSLPQNKFTTIKEIPAQYINNSTSFLSTVKSSSNNIVEKTESTISTYRIKKSSQLSTESFNGNDIKSTASFTYFPIMTNQNDSIDTVTRYSVTKKKKNSNPKYLIEKPQTVTIRRSMTQSINHTRANETLKTILGNYFEAPASDNSINSPTTYSGTKKNEIPITTKSYKLSTSSFTMRPKIMSSSSAAENDLTENNSATSQGVEIILKKPVRKELVYINEKTTTPLPIPTTKKYAGVTLSTNISSNKAVNFTMQRLTKTPLKSTLHFLRKMTNNIQITPSYPKKIFSNKTDSNTTNISIASTLKASLSSLRTDTDSGRKNLEKQSGMLQTSSERIAHSSSAVDSDEKLKILTIFPSTKFKLNTDHWIGLDNTTKRIKKDKSTLNDIMLRTKPKGSDDIDKNSSATTFLKINIPVMTKLNHIKSTEKTTKNISLLKSKRIIEKSLSSTTSKIPHNIKSLTIIFATVGNHKPIKSNVSDYTANILETSTIKNTLVTTILRVTNISTKTTVTNTTEKTRHINTSELIPTNVIKKTSTRNNFMTSKYEINIPSRISPNSTKNVSQTRSDIEKDSERKEMYSNRFTKLKTYFQGPTKSTSTQRSLKSTEINRLTHVDNLTTINISDSKISNKKCCPTTTEIVEKYKLHVKTPNIMTIDMPILRSFIKSDSDKMSRAIKSVTPNPIINIFLNPSSSSLTENIYESTTLIGKQYNTSSTKNSNKNNISTSLSYTTKGNILDTTFVTKNVPIVIEKHSNRIVKKYTTENILSASSRITYYKDIANSSSTERNNIISKNSEISLQSSINNSTFTPLPRITPISWTNVKNITKNNNMTENVWKSKPSSSTEYVPSSSIKADLTLIENNNIQNLFNTTLKHFQETFSSFSKYKNFTSTSPKITMFTTPKVTSETKNILRSTTLRSSVNVVSLPTKAYLNTQSHSSLPNDLNIMLLTENSLNLTATTAERVLKNSQMFTRGSKYTTQMNSTDSSIREKSTLSSFFKTITNVSEKEENQQHITPVKTDKFYTTEAKNTNLSWTTTKINSSKNFMKMVDLQTHPNGVLKQNLSFFSKVQKILKNRLQHPTSLADVTETYFLDLITTKFYPNLLQFSPNTSTYEKQKNGSAEKITTESLNVMALTGFTNKIFKNKTGTQLTPGIALSVLNLTKNLVTSAKMVEYVKDKPLKNDFFHRLLKAGTKINNSKQVIHKKQKTSFRIDSMKKNYKQQKTNDNKTKLHSRHRFVLREPIVKHINRHLVPIIQDQNDFNEPTNHFFYDKQTTMNANIRSKIKTDLRGIVRDGNIFHTYTLPPSREKTVRYNTYQPTFFDEFDISKNSENRNVDRFRQFKSWSWIYDNLQRNKNNTKSVDHLLPSRPTQHIIKTTEKISSQYKFTKRPFLFTTTRKFKHSELIDPSKKFKNSSELQHHYNLVEVTTRRFVWNKTHYLIDPFAKTQMYPVPPKRHRKIMKRLEGSKKTESEFSPHQYFVSDQIKDTRTKSHWTPERMNIRKPKAGEFGSMYEPFVEGIPRTYFRAKPLIIENLNDEDFYKADNDGLTVKERAIFLQETLHMPHQKTETNLEKPMEIISSAKKKPKFLRDRVDSIRNFIATYPKVTTEPRYWKDSLLTSHEDSYDELFLDPSMFFYTKTNMPGTTTSRKKRRRRRTMFFLSPTVPYNRYF